MLRVLLFRVFGGAAQKKIHEMLDRLMWILHNLASSLLQRSDSLKTWTTDKCGCLVVAVGDFGRGSIAMIGAHADESQLFEYFAGLNLRV